MFYFICIILQWNHDQDQCYILLLQNTDLLFVFDMVNNLLFPISSSIFLWSLGCFRNVDDLCLEPGAHVQVSSIYKLVYLRKKQKKTKKKKCSNITFRTSNRKKKASKTFSGTDKIVLICLNSFLSKKLCRFGSVKRIIRLALKKGILQTSRISSCVFRTIWKIYTTLETSATKHEKISYLF